MTSVKVSSKNEAVDFTSPLLLLCGVSISFKNFILEYETNSAKRKRGKFFFFGFCLEMDRYNFY